MKSSDSAKLSFRLLRSVVLGCAALIVVGWSTRSWSAPGPATAEREPPSIGVEVPPAGDDCLVRYLFELPATATAASCEESLASNEEGYTLGNWTGKGQVYCALRSTSTAGTLGFKLIPVGEGFSTGGTCQFGGCVSIKIEISERRDRTGIAPLYVERFRHGGVQVTELNEPDSNGLTTEAILIKRDCSRPTEGGPPPAWQ